MPSVGSRTKGINLGANLDSAIQSAVDGFEKLKALAPFERSAILAKTAQTLSARQQDIASLITSENGKPIRDARTEVLRAANTFAIAAEEAKRIGGEVVPLDGYLQGKNKIAFTRRFPVGPVGAITPFNFPLNLVAHKVAPALAAGCSILVKPSPRTPRIAHELVKILKQSGAPAGVVEVSEGGAEEARALTQDERIKLISFTGSATVGWELKSLAGKKKVVLELGGNAAAIVHEDADLEHAVDRLVPGSFAYSGQICISTQRIYLANRIEKEFTKAFIAKTKSLKIGDPADEKVDLGPLIDEAAAIRNETWIDEAVSAGAKLLLGGKRKGRQIPPTILTHVKPKLRVSCEEVFGPVVILESYKSFDEALTKVNQSHYGLQASVFTQNLQLVMKAHNELEVGAVIVNELPGFRVDSMPYGGVKDSGFGREGIRYAIEEMTEPRLLVISN